MGVNLAITGLQELMAPDPSTDQDASKDDTYLFHDLKQNIPEGDPFPCLWRVKSAWQTNFCKS